MSRANTKYCRVILILAFLLVKSLSSFAVNYSSVGTGNWATAATWSPAGIPVAGDNVTIGSGQTITYNGDLSWTSGTITINGTGKLVITGGFTYSGGTFAFSNTSDFQVGGSFIVDWSRNCTVGGNLIVATDVDNRGMLTVGGNLTSSNGGILNESSCQITIGSDLTAATYISNNGTLDVSGNVTVNKGYFTNGDSRTFNIGKNLITSGNIDNKGTLTIHDNCTSISGQVINENSCTLTVSGDLTSYSGLSNSGTLTITKSCTVKGGTMLNNYSCSLNIGSYLTVSGDLTNRGNFVVNGNFNLLSGNLSVTYSELMVVNGNFTKSGDVNLDGTLIITGNFISSGGNTNINQYNGNFYAFQSINENGTQAGCTDACFPNNPPNCTACQIKGLTAWQNNGSPGSTYVNLTSLWWENHLANIGESEGPTIVCPSSSSNFEVTAVDDGNLAANTFEWAVYGGNISGTGNTSTIGGHTASAKTTTGVDSNNKSAISITWESTLFAGAYVAVRQSSANACSDGKWSIFYINIQNTAAPTGATIQTFCSSLNPTVNSLIATGTAINWYSSATGGTVLAKGTLLTTGNYYASQMLNGCESNTRLEVTATVIPDGSWTGAFDNDWNNPDNWACNQIPSITTNVLIAIGKPHYPTVSTSTKDKVNNLTIDSGALLTVTGNTLQIAGAITNNGTFTAAAGTIEMAGSDPQVIGTGVIGTEIFANNTIMDLKISNSSGVTLKNPLNVTGIVTANGNLASGGNLTLVSSATQTALIAGTGTGNITGNVTMQRYLPSGFGYKYVSSPFSDAHIGQLSGFLSTTATIPTLYWYDENHKNPPITGADMTGWTVDTITTIPLPLIDPRLNPLEGYAANLGKNTDPKLISLIGTVNNGGYDTIIYNHNGTYTKGFSLVGNPYPSPIDWHSASGWTKNNIDDAIYFFDSSGATDEYSGIYSYLVNGVPTSDHSTIIPSMQGFFVHVSDGPSTVTGSLRMTNSVRTIDLKPTFKAAVVDPRTILRFAAYFDEKNSLSDAFVLYFDPLSTIYFDGEKDALKLINEDVAVPNLYSITPNNRHLSINGMPSPVDSLTKIPLGIKILKNGWINFKAKDISKLPSNIHIYLIDAIGNVTQDLKLNPTYRFYLKTGEYNQRFTLVFSLSDITKPVEVFEKMFTLTRSGDHLYAKVNLPLNTKGDLFVTNMQGQTLLRKGVFEMETVEINPNSGSGVYIVTMVSGKRTQSEKILIRKDYE